MDNPLSWYTPRTYLHFDRPTSEALAVPFVTNPEKIAKHAFYPFIGFDVNSKKRSYNAETKTLYIKYKVRPIAYASHLDSQIYSYYSHILSGLYENKLTEFGLTKNVLAFRRLQKGNIEFAHDVFNEIRKFGDCHVVALDIRKFFDRIDHLRLKMVWGDLIEKERLPDDHFRVFESLTQHTKVNRTVLFKAFGIPLRNPKGHSMRDRICEAEDFRNRVRKAGLVERNPDAFGIPQGSPISALLSNLYLLDFDKVMVNEISKVNGKYYRYCDDIFIIVPQEQQQFIELAKLKLLEVKLEINTDKEDISRFRKVGSFFRCDKPIQYLGFIFNGNKILLRPAALSKFSNRMRKAVWVAKASMEKINMARAKRGERPRAIYLKKLYKNYSYVGKRNFISYGLRAARIMNSKDIRNQLKPMWSRLQKQIR